MFPQLFLETPSHRMWQWNKLLWTSNEPKYIYVIVRALFKLKIRIGNTKSSRRRWPSCSSKPEKTLLSTDWEFSLEAEVVVPWWSRRSSDGPLTVLLSSDTAAAGLINNGHISLFRSLPKMSFCSKLDVSLFLSNIIESTSTIRTSGCCWQALALNILCVPQ